MGILTTVKDQLNELKQHRKKEKFLKQVVQVYSSPWSKRRGNFRYLEEYENERFQRHMKSRFLTDQQQILSRLFSTFAIESLEQLPEESRQTVRPIISLMALGQPDASDEELNEAIGCIGITPMPIYASFAENSAQATLIRMILDQLIQKDTVPKFYDYDHLEDIVPIVQSRYLSENGTTNPEHSQRFLDALWLLIGHELPVTDWSKLPQSLKALLGNEHGYVPVRNTIDPQAAETLSDVVEEFSAMRGEDNPERFLEINKIYSHRVGSGKEPSYSKRDLSLIRGFEANHHLMLRTIIALKNEGKIRKDDEVLIIGPRHVDEILFFRKHLGLRNTIGLDLFSEKDLVVYGDMHNMPFEDNRFRLIFSAKTFPYAYNLRKVIQELGRVTQRPGYIVNLDSAGRVKGPDPLGRTDTTNLETVLSMFYEFPNRVIAKDPGQSHNPEKRAHWPCYAVELTSSI